MICVGRKNGSIVPVRGGYSVERDIGGRLIVRAAAGDVQIAIFDCYDWVFAADCDPKSIVMNLGAKE